MIKFKYSLFLLLIFSNITYYLNAQDIQIGIGGGYKKLHHNELYTNDISENGLGLKHGNHISFKVKLDLKALPFKTAGHISYLPLKSEGTIALSHGDREIGFSSNVLSYGLGIEYKIINSIFFPYILFNMKMNKFSKTSLKEPYPVAVWTPYYQTLSKSISNETRYGIEIGIGHEFYFFPKYGLDITIKYEILNLLGKKESNRPAPVPEIFYEENINIFSVTANIFSLNK